MDVQGIEEAVERATAEEEQRSFEWRIIRIFNLTPMLATDPDIALEEDETYWEADLDVVDPIIGSIKITACVECRGEYAESVLFCNRGRSGDGHRSLTDAVKESMVSLKTNAFR